MNDLLIVGDRGLPLTGSTLAIVTLELLRAQVEGKNVVTFADEGGTAAIVRYVAAETGMSVVTIDVPRHGDGKRDYATLVNQLELGVVQVLFIGDPAICTLWTALDTLPDERVTLAILAV